MKERTLDSEEIFKGRLLHVKRDRVAMPDGSEGVREWIDHPGASAVVPVLPGGKVVMVRQFRYGPDRTFLEIPAGKFDGGEAPEAVALRELEEETGYRAGKLEVLGVLYNAVGYSNEAIHVFLGTELVKTEQALDEGEFLEVEIHDLRELIEKAGAGDLQDMKTAAGLLMAGSRMGRARG
ncbi:MAG: NUDIX hydrolase [Rhodothermales bacterium]|nr:NUDIX hydrolase [Rhodothermales bacterium]